LFQLFSENSREPERAVLDEAAEMDRRQPVGLHWECEALDFLRPHLPDHEPWRAWSNFEFINDDVRVNEVDVLVLTPAGLVLVETKSRPGMVGGDASIWRWITEGRPIEVDNPLPLANRNASDSLLC
jgi:Nuclease-related domain